MPTLSLATVYKTLETFEKHGLVSQVALPLVYGEGFRPTVLLVWLLIPGAVGAALIQSSVFPESSLEPGLGLIGGLAEVARNIATFVALYGLRRKLGEVGVLND